jgi:hypothetical protein
MAIIGWSEGAATSSDGTILVGHHPVADYSWL